MKIFSIITVSYCLLLISMAAAITVSPESISITVNNENQYFQPVGRITVVNHSDSNVTIDSIFIKLLNGDSTDFKKGADNKTQEIYEYMYNGWVYGLEYISLRYLRDSVFVLQDSLGKLVSLTTAHHDSVVFKVWLPVNCSVCARSPSFPSTTEYLYRFHSKSGWKSSVTVSINSVSATKKPYYPGTIQKAASGSKAKYYDLYGRLLPEGSIFSRGIHLITNDVHGGKAQKRTAVKEYIR